MWKKVSLFALMVLIAALGANWYFQRSLYDLPEWYEEDSPAPAEVERPADHPSAPAAPMPATPAAQPMPDAKELLAGVIGGKPVTLSEDHVSELVMTGLESRFPGRAEKMVKGIKTDVREAGMSVEMVIDPRDIPWEDLPPKAREARKIAGQFGLDMQKEIAVRLDGKPHREGDYLVFDDGASLKVGRIALPLAGLQYQLFPGNDQPLGIPVGELPFNNVELREGQLVLKKE